MNMDTLADMDTVLDNMADIVDTGKFGYDVILASILARTSENRGL